MLVHYLFYRLWVAGKHGEGKFGIFALYALHNKVALVLIYNGLDYIKSEPHAGFIKASGFIRLIETVKQPRKLLLGNTRSGILD